MAEFIKIIGDKTYKVISYPCGCPCHYEGNKIRHFTPCCNDGMEYFYEEMETSKSNLQKVDPNTIKDNQVNGYKKIIE